MAQNSPLTGREIIIEFIPLGNVMRVSAIDAATLTEVVIQGPLTAEQTVLERNAVKKLEYVLRKKGHIS
ncbi:MAG: hypothetical protein EA357_07345 [Micavibrio sp.]|nr:MAG: hypothetical protein EA357_07345 [Micavibrio sp.]